MVVSLLMLAYFTLSVSGTAKRGLLSMISDSSLGGRIMKSKRSEEHTSELQSQSNLVCRLLLEKKKNINDVEDELDPFAVQRSDHAIEIGHMLLHSSAHRLVSIIGQSPDRSLALIICQASAVRE